MSAHVFACRSNVSQASLPAAAKPRGPPHMDSPYPPSSGWAGCANSLPRLATAVAVVWIDRLRSVPVHDTTSRGLVAFLPTLFRRPRSSNLCTGCARVVPFVSSSAILPQYFACKTGIFSFARFLKVVPPERLQGIREGRTSHFPNCP